MHRNPISNGRLFGLFGRWIGTASLVALLVATSEIYKAKGYFTSAHKAAFNVLTVALTLALGLNLFVSAKCDPHASANVLVVDVQTQEALKELAHVFKYKIQTWGVTKEEKQLIRDIESLLVALRLLKTSWGRPGAQALQIFCAAWIAQAAIAVTSLTYTVNDGIDYRGIYTSSGNVNVSDHKCYQWLKNTRNDCASRVTTHTTAHIYGEMNLGMEEGSYDEISDVLGSQHLYGYYHRSSRNRQQYAYRFNEYNPSDSQRAYPFLTNRTITAEALNCIVYDQTKTDNKTPPTFTYENRANRTDQGTITIPRLFLGDDGTTYIYRGSNDPPVAPIQSCGDRCIYMWAYRNPGVQPKGAFFQCPVNISAVINAQRPEHNIPNDVAKVAAASIALQGRFIRDLNQHNRKVFVQHQFYASGSALDIQDKEADQVGEQFAKFALGSLATMVNTNPQIQVPGNLPELGHSVTLYEPYFAILMAFIVSMHLIIYIATVYWARGAEDRKVYGVGLQDLGEPPNRSQQPLTHDTEAYSVNTHVSDEHSIHSAEDVSHYRGLEEQFV